MFDVVIVGGGPTGLFLARELKLCGANPVVLEREPGPSSIPKALGLGGRSLDILSFRGLLEGAQSLAEARPAIRADQTFAPRGLMHFGGVPVALERLEGRAPQFLNLMQSDLQAFLERCAREIGVTICYNTEFLNLTELEDTVSLEIQGPDGRREMKVRYVAGCDGAHSAVRRLAGIDFPGAEPTNVLRLADVKLPAEWLAPSSWSGGRAPVVPLADGYSRIITAEPLPEDFDRFVPITYEEWADSVARSYGVRLPPLEYRWLSRFTDASRLAAQYRKGRILLAGDAAHVHLPAGGPGINAGLNDAINLGWKLAADLRDRAPAGLLDSYHSERHAAGERLMFNTRAQGAMLQPGLMGVALRTLMSELITYPNVLRDIVDRLQGNDLRYDPGPAGSAHHPLAGCWAPDVVVHASSGKVKLSRLMARGRALLVTSRPQIGLEVAKKYGRSLDIFQAGMNTDPSSPEVLFVRPDGIVGWAGCERTDASILSGLDEALSRWVRPDRD